MKTALAVTLLLATPASAQLTETLKLTAHDGGNTDHLGHAVAVDQGRVLAGAWLADTAALQSGAAYVFDATSGAELAKLAPAGLDPSDQFGYSVALDGHLAVVGAPNDDDQADDAGAAYVFDLDAGTLLHKLTAADGSTDERLGSSVGISGSTVVVGCPLDGDTLSSSGSAYLFDALTGAQLHKLTANDADQLDQFGTDVAIHGSRVLVASPQDDGLLGASFGSAYLFDAGTGQQLDKLLPLDASPAGQFASAVALGSDYAVVGASGDDEQGFVAGAAYVFDAVSGAQLSKLLPQDGGDFDLFGQSAAIDGDLAIIGTHTSPGVTGFNYGKAYLFDLSMEEEITKVLPADPALNHYFAHGVSLADGQLIVGAYGDSEADFQAGAVYVYDLGDGGNAWTDQGFALGGVAGDPLLAGTGDLSDGSANAVTLTDAAPGALSGLFIALGPVTPVPFKGGTLAPLPPLIPPVILPTDGSGSIALPFVQPSGVPAGTELHVQFAIQDGAAPNGVALSNALLGVTP